MWSRTYSTTTTAITATQLWRLYEDVNNWASWDDELELAAMDGRFEQGTYFKLKPKGGPNLKVLLSEVVPYKRFTDITFLPLAKMYDEHIFEETSEGLKITNRLSVKGPLAFLWVKLVAGKLAEGFPADTEKKIRAAAKL